MSSSKDWYRDNFLVSTSNSLLQLDAINRAFGSDDVYWASSTSEEEMKKMLSKSLCFGLYLLPESSAELAGKGGPTQIGLARLVTDEVTIAFLTDVYVLKEYRGKGLGIWLIECVNETINTWPNLRRVLLLSNDTEGARFYKKILDVDPYPQGAGGHFILSRKGPALLLPH